jgi:hypothetical protein
MRLHFFKDSGDIIIIDRDVIIVVGIDGNYYNCVDNCNITPCAVLYGKDFVKRWSEDRPGKVFWNGY